MSEHRFTNALAGETSPYLLQHAHNPVQWYPWSEEALNRAVAEDKPILLSIGYSACHWCHVMEQESFENEKTADLMNRHFINIKVDREERPDLDTIYMSAVQMMTGSGGWPMTVFLTPGRIPFYAGTYFPPQDRHGMPGFPRVLESVARAYQEKKELILRDTAKVVEELRRGDSLGESKGELSVAMLDTAASNLLVNYDAENGGFGTAPKFPPSMALSYLLRNHARTGHERSLEVVEQTLQKMAFGGIFDQLGGGFHRYSVDSRWLVPHFEKMLYDNALLSRIYLDTYLRTGNPLYRRVAEETLDYILREMTSPEGGFYSTQDADSEGHEGKFFVWTPGEVMSILGAQDADLFCSYFDVTPEGNFEGKNILNAPRPGNTVARFKNVSQKDFRDSIARSRRLLFLEREKRVKPGRDEKILTAWNGLMMRSFAEAANALDRDDYREAAARNATFVLSRLRRDGRLLRSCKGGETRFNAYLEDYASLIDGLLSVYEATFAPSWIHEATRLSTVLAERFWDADEGCFFFTSDDHEPLIHRPKDFYDNATPSGNSVAAGALLRLSRLTGDQKWANFAHTILTRLGEAMTRHPSAFGNYLCALDYLLSDQMEIAIVGDSRSEEAKAMLREIFRLYLPNKVTACGADGEPPLLRSRPQVKGRATAYVCRGSICLAPATTPAELGSQLTGRPSSSMASGA